MRRRRGSAGLEKLALSGGRELRLSSLMDQPLRGAGWGIRPAVRERSKRCAVM